MPGLDKIISESEVKQLRQSGGQADWQAFATKIQPEFIHFTAAEHKSLHTLLGTDISKLYISSEAMTQSMLLSTLDKLNLASQLYLLLNLSGIGLDDAVIQQALAKTGYDLKLPITPHDNDASGISHIYMYLAAHPRLKKMTKSTITQSLQANIPAITEALESLKTQQQLANEHQYRLTAGHTFTYLSSPVQSLRPDATSKLESLFTALPGKHVTGLFVMLYAGFFSEFKDEDKKIIQLAKMAENSPAVWDFLHQKCIDLISRQEGLKSALLEQFFEIFREWVQKIAQSDEINPLWFAMAAVTGSNVPFMITDVTGSSVSAADCLSQIHTKVGNTANDSHMSYVLARPPLRFIFLQALLSIVNPRELERFLDGVVFNKLLVRAASPKSVLYHLISGMMSTSLVPDEGVDEPSEADQRLIAICQSIMSYYPQCFASIEAKLLDLVQRQRASGLKSADKPAAFAMVKTHYEAYQEKLFRAQFKCLSPKTLAWFDYGFTKHSADMLEFWFRGAELSPALGDNRAKTTDFLLSQALSASVDSDKEALGAKNLTQGLTSRIARLKNVERLRQVIIFNVMRLTAVDSAMQARLHGYIREAIAYPGIALQEGQHWLRAALLTEPLDKLMGYAAVNSDFAVSLALALLEKCDKSWQNYLGRTVSRPSLDTSVVLQKGGNWQPEIPALISLVMQHMSVRKAIQSVATSSDQVPTEDSFVPFKSIGICEHDTNKTRNFTAEQSKWLLRGFVHHPGIESLILSGCNLSNPFAEQLVQYLADSASIDIIKCDVEQPIFALLYEEANKDQSTLVWPLIRGLVYQLSTEGRVVLSELIAGKGASDIKTSLFDQKLLDYIVPLCSRLEQHDSSLIVFGGDPYSMQFDALPEPLQLLEKMVHSLKNKTDDELDKDMFFKNAELLLAHQNYVAQCKAALVQEGGKRALAGSACVALVPD